MKTFKINEKNYEAKEFDFGMVCDFEDMNLSLRDINKKHISFTRAYFAICANLEKDEATNEIQEHIKKGGDLNELTSCMFEQIYNSDFFHAITEKEDPEKKE